MQIERSAMTPSSILGETGKAYCALECDNCSGICLAVYFMLTPDERTAVCGAVPNGFAAVQSGPKRQRRLS